ncbi:gluconeogenesis factor YvcK family protein [Erysipelotrichaceae bacterium HCN-30851]
MKNVVVIGGGTGLSVMMRGLKQIKNINLTAIVTVADDGGSTGRIRRQFHIPAMGDIRNVMCAMAEEESIFTSLMNYRFEGEEGDVGGHNLGNLILTALTKTTGSFMEAIQTFSKFLNVKGEIIPSSLQVITLYAVMEDGTIVRGESNIPNFDNQIERVFYEEKVEPTREALQAIHEADVIVYGIGSLYTSIIPNLIVDGIVDELKKNPVKKIYFCNAMTQPGETDNFSLEDHVRALQNHSYEKAIDIVITHNNRAEQRLLDKYKAMGSVPVRVMEEKHSYTILERDVLSFDDDLIRHDSNKIRDVLEEIINSKDEVECHLQQK